VENGKKSSKGILRLLRKFARDCHGLSAIEFAFVFPVMASLYLGGTALTQGIVLKRKVTLVTRTAGDLASQETDITDAEMNTLLQSAAVVLDPYLTNTLTITLTAVQVDKNGVGKVRWSSKSTNKANFVQGYAVGSTLADPTGALPKLVITGQSTDYLMVEGHYTYTPPVAQRLVGTVPLDNTFYLRPRRVLCITRNSVACT
jgi:Flp pilus assembly protein TadG